MTKKIVAIDPGGATGWSKWHFHEDGPLLRVDYGVTPGGLDGFKVDATQKILLGADIVICEKYKLDGRTPNPDLTPTYIEGAIAMALYADGREDSVVWQTTDMKAMVRDQVLRDAGLWLTGAEVCWTDGRDVNDSAIHALAWAKSIDHQPTIAHYWPDN